MTVDKAKCSETQMLIRQPVSDVFEAFIDPAITTHFWFTKSDGKLEVGKLVFWEWEMYNVKSGVVPKEIIQDKKISIDWGRPATQVDFNFEAVEGGTYVNIVHDGFDKTGDELVQAIKNSTEGFTIVLAGLKAWMEHGIELGLVGDKFPKGYSRAGR